MNKPSRRAVVRTGVWTVPVVAAATAAPALAVSGTKPPVTIGGTGKVCKDQGSGQNTKDYEFTLTLTNTTNADQTVMFTDINFQGQDNVPTPASVVVPANSSINQTFKLFNFDDSSSNPVATVYYSVANSTYSTSVTFKTPIHPCQSL